jgi:hypothetical protein
MSDGTHLSNFAGDKKEWPVNRTFGNRSSKIRQKHAMHSVLIVVLLPIPFMSRNIPQTRLDGQRQTNRGVLNKVLQHVLQLLTVKQHPSAESWYFNVFCAGRNIRRCKLVLASSKAYCPEYSNLHHLERHVCFWLECAKNELGDYVHPDKQHPQWDHNLYRTLSPANTTAADAELSSPHVH